MARKDDLLQKFLEHEIISEKYKIAKEDLPLTVRQAENSEKPIIRVIALYINGLEDKKLSEKQLREQILRYLNQANTNT